MEPLFDTAWYLRPSVSPLEAADLAAGAEPVTGDRQGLLTAARYADAAPAVAERRAATFREVLARLGDGAAWTQRTVAEAVDGLEVHWPAPADGLVVSPTGIDELHARVQAGTMGEDASPRELASALAWPGDAPTARLDAARVVSCLLAGTLRARADGATRAVGLCDGDTRLVVADVLLALAPFRRRRGGAPSAALAPLRRRSGGAPSAAPAWMTDAAWAALLDPHAPDHPPELLVALRGWVELRDGGGQQPFRERFAHWYKKEATALELPRLGGEAVGRCAVVANYGERKKAAVQTARATKKDRTAEQK